MAYFRSKKAARTGTDRATRAYASRVSRKYGSGSKELREVTTFISPWTGERIARGSFQAVGLSAASMGFGTGMTGFKVTGDTGLTGYEFAAKYQQMGTSESGEALYFPRTSPGIPKAPAARGMVGAQTTSYAPAGFGKAAMGGMGRGEWERPQIPKEDAEGGAGIGTVAVLGGAAYLIWSILK